MAPRTTPRGEATQRNGMVEKNVTMRKNWDHAMERGVVGYETQRPNNVQTRFLARSSRHPRISFQTTFRRLSDSRRRDTLLHIV
jgi:hypothetical protein